MKRKLYLALTAIVLLVLNAITYTARGQNATPQQGIHNETRPAKGDQRKNCDDEYLKRIEQFLDDLEKDTLIDRKKFFTIEHQSGELMINGKRQPLGVYNKYRDILEKHKFARIRQDSKGFLIYKS